MSNYSIIRSSDISNGPGIRVSVFFSGCEFHCKNCFNSEAWDFNAGKTFTENEINIILDLMSKDYIQGLSILGGEPLHPRNLEAVSILIDAVKAKYQFKDIWLWSGYIIETLSEEQKNVVLKCDNVVDGQFVDELKDYRLKYRGSSNQRVIDIKESKKQNKIVLNVTN